MATLLGPAPVRDALSGTTPAIRPWEDRENQQGAQPGLLSKIWQTWLSRLVDTVNRKPYAVRSVTANATLDPINDCVLFVDCTSGNIAVTMPSYVDIVSGQPFCVKKIDSSANIVTISTPDTKTIEGSTTMTISMQNEFVWLVPDGSNWQKVG